MSEIINYTDFRESLDLALKHEVNHGAMDEDTREAILGTMDDAVGNNADQLVLWEDVPYEVEMDKR